MPIKGMPVLVPLLPDYKQYLSGPTSCMVYISSDKATVLKQPISLDLTGCTPEIQDEYGRWSKESADLLDRERSIYRRLGSHPSVLQCLEFRDEGLVFEYMQRGDLRRVLKAEGPPDQGRQITWARNALDAIVYAHSKGILIGDIRAPNFLVRDDASIVLCDFSGSGIDAEKSMVGYETRYEKIEGHKCLPISMAMEIFATGSLLYEICAGVRPYNELQEDTEVEALYRQKIFPDTSSLILGDIIKRCWHGDFDTSAEVQQALADLYPAEPAYLLQSDPPAPTADPVAVVNVLQDAVHMKIVAV